MPSSLFLKIFLWFWMAISLVAGVFLLSLELNRSEGQAGPFHRLTRSALALHLQTAEDVLAKKGLSGLQQYLSDHGDSSEIETVVFDSEGRQVFGRAVSREILDWIRQTRPGEQIDFRRRRGMWLAARIATGSQGAAYTLLSKLQPPRFPAAPSLTDLLLRLLAVILTGGVVCYGLARYLASPVTRLQRATRRLASGDLSTRVGEGLERRRDEFSDLGQDFDHMATRIERLINSQRRLLRDISHELRSPLARLNVALELARKHSTEEAQPSLNRIEREAGRMNEMIGQLLKLARLESNREPAEQENVSLTELIRDVLEDARFEAGSLNRSVRVVESEACVIRGFRTLLRSALDNVIRNALFHTREQTAVELFLICRQEPGETGAVIRVRDHGPGLPEAELNKIFQPFYRVDSARDPQSGGTGLGLAIARRIIQLHGGTIEAANASPGLLIEIRLPAGRQP